MSHEIETMAYAGKVPWHGLGEKVEDNMTPEEMLVAAGLDWSVSKRQAYTVDKPNCWNIIDPTGEAQFIKCEDHYYVVRDTDNKVLSHCKDSYVPFQNKEVMSFFKKFTKAGQMTMETAGSLKNGKEIWGLAKISSDFKLAGGDHVESYLLLNNSHSVGKAMTIMLTPIRVVCNNTLQIALRDGSMSYRIPHVRMFDEEIIQSAEQALGLSTEQMKTFKEQSEFLASKKAKDKEVDTFVAELFQPSLVGADNIREALTNTADTVRRAIETSPGAELSSSKGTWWGALNGVTYVMDHTKRAKEKEEGNALHSAFFGSGANLKRKALTRAIEYAKAA
jgi:phage/plasmid-like protein (TIGR03299 family)|tara:strand:- start:653 stop:1657 length:1005 start_codon:yes stop_codon:yes gene_type:complete